MLPRVREFYGLERLWGTAEVAAPAAPPKRKRTPRTPKA
jgi:hypothetical protein